MKNWGTIKAKKSCQKHVSDFFFHLLDTIITIIIEMRPEDKTGLNYRFKL